MLVNKIHFPFSIKNITLSKKQAFKKKLVAKTEEFINRLRWHVQFRHVLEISSSDQRNKFGLKSPSRAPVVDVLKGFEKDLWNMISRIRFKDRKALSGFQNELDSKVADIISDKSNKIIKSDKTSNIYKINSVNHDKLLSKSVEKSYKLANNNWTDLINIEIEHFAEKLGIQDIVQKIRPQPAFISIKDHKPSWKRDMPTRLINPANSDLCKISKHILDKILKNLREKHQHLNQFRNSDSVLEWFDKKKGHEHLLLSYDIESFYPSITKTTLEKCMDWAEEHVIIDHYERQTIMAARRSVLFFRDEVWTKKGEPFDVTMGSSDGAEISELVGLFLLDRMDTEGVLQADLGGLYRDDGLVLIPQAMSDRDGEKLRQKIRNLFKKYGFKIKLTPISSCIDFLDIMLHSDNTYEVYHKPNANTNYVHSKSNHPKNILKNMSKNTEHRLSKLCSSKELFDKHKDFYSDILRNSDHRSVLQYDENPKRRKDGRSRPRKVVWYNPPFCLSVKTKIGKQFFDILEKHFPEPETDPETGLKPPRTGLNLILNKNTVKLSFSTMNNIAAIFKQHNKKANAKPSTDSEKTCSCPKTKICPVKKKCLTENVVYEASVTEKSGPFANQTSTYTGLASTTFKNRFYSHTSAIKNKKVNQTALSAFIHDLKDLDIEYELTWKILEVAPSYDGRFCRLCLAEKTHILFNRDPNLLNKRTELMGGCRHKEGWTFSSEPASET